MDGVILLLFGFDRLRIDRGAAVLAILDLEMPGGVACLFEGFGDDDGHRLAPVADRFRALCRGLVGRALRRARDEQRIVDDREHTGHGESGILVDRGDLAPGDGREDEHAFGAVLDRIFGRIGRGAGDLGEPFDAGDGLADHALLHAVEPVGRVGFVLFQEYAHDAVSAACSRTACNVRRASGILKSFSP